MGFLDFLLGDKCEYCGSRSLKVHNRFKTPRGEFRILACESCRRVYLDKTGDIPKCWKCGTRQTLLGRNEYNVILPKCPNCGYVYDGYDYDDD